MRCTPAFWPAMTPGVNRARSLKLRLEIGRFWTDSVGIVKDRSPLAAWISGDSPVTTMVSAIAPTSSITGGRASRSPALTARPEVFSVLKPVRDTVTV